MVVHTCPECGMEFEWPGVEEDGEGYCCEACSRGEPCTCVQHEHHQEMTDVPLPGNLHDPRPVA